MIQYPTDNKMYDVVKVTFTKELNEMERERAINIAKYWGSIHYTGEFQEAHMSDGNTLFVSTKERECSRRHTPLEQLGYFLNAGTNVKIKDGQRTYEGLGNIVKVISGL
jgi:hypothetical protein